MALDIERLLRRALLRPPIDPTKLALSYANFVREIPHVEAAWAELEGNVLCLYALILPDRETEREVHEAETKVIDMWPDAPLRFRVFRTDEWIPPRSEEAVTLFERPR